MKRHKYGAIAAYRCRLCNATAHTTKCLSCGSDDLIRFDSRREAMRWDELRLLLRAGEISDLKRQVAFPVIVNGEAICKYIADFVYVETADNSDVVEDVKGVDTAISKLKRKLVAATHGVEVRIVR